MLRDRITALVEGWSYQDGAAAVRIATVVEPKGASYWRQRGRERAERELTEDGVSADRIDAVLLTIDDALGPDLDSILADLKARERA